MVDTIRERYEHILERIMRAAQAAGRNPADVQLVVVTKTHEPETVYAAIQAGAYVLGENYAEEGLEKMQTLAAMGVNMSEVRWHMIGHVQSRKAALIARHFDLIHSLDSVKLARRLSQFAGEENRILPVLLQLNVSGEESKAGLPAWDVGQHQDTLTETVTEILNFSQLSLQGLMTLPPFFDDPARARPYFRKLQVWRERLSRQFPQVRWEHLSMGMSGDFEVAIQEGATLVRIGTAILGART
ncbi:MAG: YggS family pyridoxal phosphate-dependent enzyme [Anaerolineales bacterium]|nr:YggS family pyridoxal phosphate-dependent enzyme [Anaerolineales bacterium]